jgi:putative transposase
MTRLEDRQILKRDIAQARADGSRLAPARALAGLDPRTLQRWKTGDGLSVSDRRPDADRPVPSHALSEAEQARIIAVANEPRFSETPPARIVPALGEFLEKCGALAQMDQTREDLGEGLSRLVGLWALLDG